ncbi:MAG TPA: hypothetical protein VF266_18795 [Thermoanaerobaculia bacterium]
MDKIALIHFIGLALFSTQVPGNEGALRVLLPRIEQHQSITNHTMTSAGDGTTMRRIESHVAAVIYRESDMLQEIGWESEAVPEHMLVPTTGAPVPYRMARLDGERLTFLATGDNAAAQPSQLRLPKPTCGTRLSRRIDVAATVSIPAGTLASCRDADRNRYDTRLSLKNRSVITLWAESEDAPTKALVLDGNATVYVVNIPTATVDAGATSESMTTAHYLAYYTLLRSRPDRNCVRELVDPAGTPSICAPLPFAVTPPAPEGTMALVNEECSNTAWP